MLQFYNPLIGQLRMKRYLAEKENLLVWGNGAALFSSPDSYEIKFANHVVTECRCG